MKKNNAFFIEIICVTLFFALAATVTLRIFAAAKETSVKSVQVSHAAIVCQDGIEKISAGQTNDFDVKDGVYSCGYDTAWRQTIDNSAVAYLLCVTVTAQEGGLSNVSATVTQGEKELFTLSTLLYEGGAR